MGMDAHEFARWLEASDGAQDAARALETFQSLRALVVQTWNQLVDEAGRIDDAHPPGSAP